ncbi:hypothetical protein TrST_g14113 [Triparma strigata]|uniref:Uncharacterized protein n=1 Tax=Triparma strigata TaxID=1606541 RepID=A0A9W7AG80_9STRA|nr:hypothetical protein TrST_g14113 [Triparma strigata]
MATPENVDIKNGHKRFKSWGDPRAEIPASRVSSMTSLFSQITSSTHTLNHVAPPRVPDPSSVIKSKPIRVKRPDDKFTGGAENRGVLSPLQLKLSPMRNVETPTTKTTTIKGSKGSEVKIQVGGLFYKVKDENNAEF